MSTLSVPVFGLGAAVQHASPPASALAKGKGTAGGKGKMRALAPRMPKQDLALAVPHSHFNSSSPLSSLPSASAGPSPAGAAPGPAAGSWWVSGVGSVYSGGGSGEQDTATNANASGSTSTSRVQGYGYYGYGAGGENTGHMQHSNPDLTRQTSTTQAVAPALDVRHKDNGPKERKQVITYMSRAKKAGGSTSGKSTSSGSSMGWNKDEQEWRKPKVKLFLRSPKMPHSALPSSVAIPSTPYPAEDGADPRALFTPSPQPLFMSPPSPPPDVWRRGPPAPGVGVARQAGREERRSERMKYVLVPPAPYVIKRARKRTWGMGAER
ncbi:hypothetical protein B0H14DRAFT_1514476 [Mycena olivaceomarginata]|nr:hypothetical protein B0H14DRAFT_1514476 [Mycena olivaceomarginata]